MSIKIIAQSELRSRSLGAIPQGVLEKARHIVEDIRAGGKEAAVTYAQKFDQLGDRPLLVTKEERKDALDQLKPSDRQVLESAAGRIRTFAEAHRAALQDFEITEPLSGARMGVRHQPVDCAGCYAPGGRYPLVSSILMTVIPAKVAGVKEVVLATPNATPLMLAAAEIAGADAVLRIGGAQAIASLAFGISGNSHSDMIVGPGNQWVTAAKQIISAERGIDMLAGPSELLIIADDSAPPDLIAADLLAQAEHDVEAIPLVICTSQALAEKVQTEVDAQLNALPEPNRSTARAALENGGVVISDSPDDAVRLANDIAPEHLEIMTENPEALASRCRNFGGLFIGSHAAEVFGDYGIGPNHTLPTSGVAKFSAGLSVAHFLRAQTYIACDQPVGGEIVDQTVKLARMEGLEGHAQAALRRRGAQL
ncbi:MAG: histidinol dehydrogenase [Armatimonadetes bacterium]|nr:histidinol dehydrogenase [Armatimonadota bacterium]